MGIDKQLAPRSQATRTQVLLALQRGYYDRAVTLMGYLSEAEHAADYLLVAIAEHHRRDAEQARFCLHEILRREAGSLIDETSLNAGGLETHRPAVAGRSQPSP